MENTKRAMQMVANVVLVVVVLACSYFLLYFGHRYFYKQAYPLGYSEQVSQFSRENNLPQSMVYAVIRTESGFRPNAISSVGAKGLMQMTDETLDWVQYRMGTEKTGSEVLYDGVQNIQYGCFLLKLLLAQFGSETNALAAYHAGWGNVSNWLEDERYAPDGKNLVEIPIPETKAYVAKVLSTREVYQKLYELP